MKKIFALMIVCILMSVLLILPAYASCDTCMSQEVDIDWAAHCEAACSCSWGPCPDCGEPGVYVEDFCGATHSYTWSNPSDTTHKGVCACGKTVEGNCELEEDAYKAPECEAHGYRYFVCNICGGDVLEDIPASGHNWGSEPSYDSATCFSVGVAVYVCGTCGEEESRASMAIPHIFVNSKCTMCGLSENAVTTKPAETSKPVETTRPIGGAVIPGDLMGDHLSGNGIDNIVDARALLGVFMIGSILIVVCYLIKKKR